MQAKLDVVGIVTADMGKTLAFYRLLGLAVPADADSQPHVEVALPGGLRLAFDTQQTIRSFHPGWRPGTGQLSLAFRLPDAVAVDAAYAQVTAAGYHGELAPFDAFWGQRYAMVRDPDGNGVALFAPLPASS
ncbi:VOC family protein [Pseudonocardia asaccharolytica]|uniref:VOC family protein n=1 Tax=Pseudonocardia asaccharolytica TaxID=54010 RepID=UPI00048EAAE1|nr:VOC family protein [Pseudonocardia asaccharolytica]